MLNDYGWLDYQTLYEVDGIQQHEVFPFTKHGLECFAVINLLTKQLSNTFFSRGAAEQRASYLSRPELFEPGELILDVKVTKKRG